jgi:hypothetical protein
MYVYPPGSLEHLRFLPAYRHRCRAGADQPICVAVASTYRCTPFFPSAFFFAQISDDFSTCALSFLLFLFPPFFSVLVLLGVRLLLLLLVNCGSGGNSSRAIEAIFVITCE